MYVETLPEIATGAEEATFTFTFDAVPGPEPEDPPVLLPFGPPSLTALVTIREATIEILLLSQGLPPGSQVYFDKTNPISWHGFNGPAIPQPDWVTDLNAEAAVINFRVNNPAGTTDPAGLLQPIIVGFTPNVLYAPTANTEPIPIDVPDPSIVNVDPTGGSN